MTVWAVLELRQNGSETKCILLTRHDERSIRAAALMRDSRLRTEVSVRHGPRPCDRKVHEGEVTSVPASPAR